MKMTFVVLGLAFVWAAISGSFSGLNLLLGAAVGLAVALLFRRGSGATGRTGRPLRLASLVALFVWELLVSAVRVGVIVLRPDLRTWLKPAIVAFPLSVKSDAEITLLANLITLTPGTLSVDVAEDRSVLYVHVLHLTDREVLIRALARGFERKVKEVFE